jgi:biopolymer transport protein ExbD
MKMKTDQEADVNITSLIDCLMQCIIFFMVILTAEYIYGVAIKFPQATHNKENKQTKQEKNLIVYVQSDYLDRAPDGGQKVIQDGVLKLNGKEIALVTDVKDTAKWASQREYGFTYLKAEMKRLIDKEGYKKDMLLIQGDMKSYHWKIMKVIDAAKEDSIEAFSLVPPSQ